MSLPFPNTAPGYDEELGNSVFFEHVCTRRHRLAAATGRSVDQVAVDLRRGLVLPGPQALDYGLVSSVR